jgi:hypothetical protein
MTISESSQMPRFSKLALILTIATLVGASSLPAHAYPAGQAFKVTASRYTGIDTGSKIGVSGQNVYPGCRVNFSFLNVRNSPTASAISGAGNKTPIVQISVPNKAGIYTLEGVIASGCRSTVGGTRATATITVGRERHIDRHKFSYDRQQVSKNPTLTYTGTIYWGTQALASQDAVVTLTDGKGKTVGTQNVTTDRSGNYSAIFKGAAKTAGTYTVTAFVASNNTYLEASAQDSVVLIK